MSETKNPAVQPGEGARAIDTFRTHYISKAAIVQAEKSVREHQLLHLADGFDYFGECACMLAYLAGYAPEMTIRDANDMVTKLINERRHLHE